MKKILITGATGNVGHEVIKCLFELKTGNKIVAGVRNIQRAKKQLLFEKIEYVHLTLKILKHSIML